MTKGDIIRMAREAYGDWYPNAVPPELERFAVLVAAAERERLHWDSIHTCGPDCDRPPCVRVREAVEAEREACARLCDMIADPPAGSGWDDVFEGGVEAGADRCADAIRARSEK